MLSVKPIGIVTEAGVDQLKVEIKQDRGSQYTTGNPYTATVDIDDPPSGAAPWSASPAPPSPFPTAALGSIGLTWTSLLHPTPP